MGLKSLRLDKGWSQEQLATISGLSHRTIQRAERGETPSLETLRALASSFELTPARLRDLIQPQETERPDMASTDTPPNPAPNPPADTTGPNSGAGTTGPDTGPVIGPATKRILIAVGVYIAVMSWLAVMQAVAGWDPELLPFIGLTGAGLVATTAFMALGGDKPEAD
ncbi:helix-turn-helix transcriptional regulator [uncultured Maricaulis sp.]|uniref:helix-turn-helix domain-containing protein n=1 Tax=uncultured Maricaulis sp. TaxID=174710 RepID=UPI002613FAC2|nr:helix-turn-helix transcriptional regulator [uncultured Maricaulis sp.]